MSTKASGNEPWVLAQTQSSGTSSQGCTAPSRASHTTPSPMTPTM